MSRPRRRCHALAACAVLACGACGAAAPPEAQRPREDLAGLDGSRWTWVGAGCVDGSLDVAALGFERELRMDAAGTGLLFTYDDALAARGCTRSAVWRATAEAAGGVRLEPQAFVTLPVGAACGPEAAGALHGRLRHGQDTLEVVEERSPWCRGLDARFEYHRVERAALQASQVVRRWVAHFNRRDAGALSRLFADTGALIEPFSATSDGAYRRHQGRVEVRAWLDSAFASTPWLALRLTGVEASDDAGGLIAQWEYMDAHLAEPFVGRNLFVVAGGEIFETEIQLVGTPRPRADAKVATPDTAGTSAPGASP